MPFLASQISARAINHLARGRSVSLKIVPLVALNCFPHSCYYKLHFFACVQCSDPRFLAALKDSKLLVSQGLDGIEAGGFDGRIHAEEEAHAHGDAHGEHDGP